MSPIEVVEYIFLMLAGLGVFMFGMKHMSDSLEAGSADKLRVVLTKMTNTRAGGILTGAIVTGAIQSSSATTVMVVGFVNAGVLTLTQATSVIMGANIGTTLTGFIISMQALPVTQILAALACVGIFMLMFSKNNKVLMIANIFVGLGMIFVGLYIMSDSMGSFAEIDSVRQLFIKTTNPFLLLFMSMLLTAIIQSSAATTGIVMTFATTGLMSMESALFAVLGMNIGTCITAILAAIGTSTNAKRTACIHFLFNVIGTVIFGCVFAIPSVRGFFLRILPKNITFGIAVFHLIFNLVTTLMLVGFTKPLVALVEHVISDKKNKVQEDDPFKFKYLNDNLLVTPAIAAIECKREIMHMASLAYENVIMSLESITNNNNSMRSEFDKRESVLDFLNREIPSYMVKLSAELKSSHFESRLATYYKVISDVERLGDYAENIMEYTDKLIESGLSFSDDAKQNINDMFDTICKLFNCTLKSFEKEDTTTLLQAEVYEEEVDKFNDRLSEEHVARLKQGICSVECGTIFLSLISNLERVADHMLNIGKSIYKYVD